MSARPQVGIDRLPARRMSNEPRESMNCKSCRKRKIKCNRLRPTCEACQVFQCPCIYDAVPKKRGPKTDVLEALLKRVDGLERRLKDEKKSQSPKNEHASVPQNDSPDSDTKAKKPHLDTAVVPDESAVYSPTSLSEPSPPAIQPDVLLDTYFTRCHGKPFHILDETAIRQRVQANEIPPYLLYAIYAVSARYAAHPNGYHAAVMLSEDYARRARTEIDIDEPSIDTLQALLHLEVAYTAEGKGKKAYMMLASAVGMAMALELHREIDPKLRVTPVEREMRRRLFWACYLMDRFASCGSKRSSLMADESINLRLPSWARNHAALSVEGDYFQNTSNLQSHSSGKSNQGSNGMLINIIRILGITNRYLTAGGVKGDSHFPWHADSNLSKIRQSLDVWASGTQDVFSSVDTLFGQPDSTTLVLSKLIYHLIHSLIYRPFLPIDLAELAGAGQQQSWQIEATNMCFLHANAIAELVELGKQSVSTEWPAFVGYCICTAGTVHVHGAHYRGGQKGEVFSASADFLSREMHQLSDLRFTWASVQHQRDTLQTVYGSHSELVKALASNPMRYSPVFHLEHFFDRYSNLGLSFDGAHLSLTDTLVETTQEMYHGHDLYAPPPINAPMANALPQEPLKTTNLPTKRKASTSSRKKHESLKISHRSNSHTGHPDHNGSQMISPNGIPETNLNINQQQQQQLLDPNAPPLTPFPPNSATMPTHSQTPFSPPYAFSSLHNMPQTDSYDPMFGMPQVNYSSTGMMMGGMIGGNEGMTPGGRSNGESTGTNEGEKDPFLSLLEQLAENEHSRGGPSELDFFLSGGNG